MLRSGTGSFLCSPFPDRDRAPLRVHYYAPPELEEDTPVIFVLHGERRDGRAYRNRWTRHAREEGFLLLAPVFDAQTFPSYNLAGMVDPSGDGTPLTPQEDWAFHCLDQIFEAVRRYTPVAANRYAIYGHSAGAQFVHRLVLFCPDARFQVAVAANAGWYTLPRLDRGFPYGLADAPVTTRRLRRALSRRLIVLLGEEDTDPEHAFLRRTPRANRQGDHRLDRGLTFYKTGKRLARKLATPFRWEVETVPEAAHRDRDMARAALRRLLDD